MKLRVLSLAVIAAIFLSILVHSGGTVRANHTCGYVGPWTYAEVDITRAIARSDGGHTIELSGTFMGYLDDRMEPDYFGGSYVHRDVGGAIVSEGVWHVEEVVKWKYYGCLEGVCCVMGGRGVFRSRFVSTDGNEFAGYVDLESPVGDDTPPGAVDGARVSIKAWNLYFTQPLGGHVFVWTL